MNLFFLNKFYSVIADCDSWSAECGFMIDECHLLWGDICGYVWGKTTERVTIPVINAREKQTYYGALDYKTKEFLIYPAKKGNSENTIKFLEYLRVQRP